MKRLLWLVLPALTFLSACQANEFSNQYSSGKKSSKTAYASSGSSWGGGDGFSFASSDNNAETSYKDAPTRKGLFAALVRQESGGRNNVVSHAGAVGRAQLTLPTARIMARKLGMYRVASLSRGQLKRELIKNPHLNEKLGRAYLDEGRRKYGRDDLALIYYNGGPVAADVAHKSLKTKGHMVIYTGETYCYVKKISHTAGIDTAPMKLVKGRAYQRNKSRWVKRTGHSPCRA